MKNQKFMVAFFSSLLALAIQGNAQTLFQVTFKGTCQTTNDAGEIVTQQINNRSLIQDAVTSTGISNSASLTLVYAQSASTDPSVPGDFIEVVDITNGIPVYTNLLFLYGGLFPPPLTNAAQTEVVIGAQVLPMPLAISESLGGVTINQRTSKKLLIRGSFNYTVLKTVTNTPTVQACNGTFTVGKPFAPQP